MFSGIIEELGVIGDVGPSGLSIGAQRVMEGSDVDSSVAVNGVCLTVVEKGDSTLSFDVTPETLQRSSLGRLKVGDPVNLERPLTLATRLGGHIVLGHVDGIGTIADVVANETGATVVVRTPLALMRYVVEKGSIAVDGVSLTVAALDEDSFTVALIPHTLEMTTLGAAGRGDPVNLEVDILAKYVERLLSEPVRMGDGDE